MRNIDYDLEGDILTVTFAESKGRVHTGVELTDNIVLYFDPTTEEPLQLILVSYRRLLEAPPIRLDGLAEVPDDLRAAALRLVRRAPVANFLRLEEGRRTVPAGRVTEIFLPTMLGAMTPATTSVTLAEQRAQYEVSKPKRRPKKAQKAPEKPSAPS
jgi:CRP-like cAMP-binding protein